MKKIICDKCGVDNAKTYKYPIGEDPDPSGNGYNTNWKYTDLCLNCVQDWVILHLKKLTEVSGNIGTSTKKVIYG